MQIHELPSASPSASDYIPIDNGTATRKTTLSSIDIGSNEITFTSGDTSSPSSWQTVAVMASNTAANLMASISKMIANIRWLYNRLGTSSTGTTATTVTGAIAEHSTKIGNAEMGTTATTLTGAIAEVNDSVNTNTEDIATLNSNLEPTPLTVTYTTNSYCTSTALAACFAYKVGNILIFKFNLTLSSYPSGPSYDNIEIGRISDWSTEQDTYYTIAPQNGTSAAGILLLRITRSGIIYMLNRSGTACVGYYRQVVVTPYE